MATEDLTTYTVNDPESDFTITASQVVVDTCDNDIDAHLYDDKGAGTIGDFEHTFKLIYTTQTDGSAFGCWSVSSTYHSIQDMSVNNEGIVVFMNNSVPNEDIYLKDYGNDNADFYQNAGFNTFYTTADRASTTATLKIYSDADRLNLLDTLTITCLNTAHRYVAAVTPRNGSASSKWITFTLADLDLGEGGSIIPLIMHNRRRRVA